MVIMLKAASLTRILSRSCLISQNLLVHQAPTGSLKLRPNNPLWTLKGCRCIMDGPGKEISASVEASMKSRDNIQNDFRIIYRAPHEKYVKVTYMTSFIGLVTVPVLAAAISLSNPNQTYPMELGGITLFETANHAYVLLGILVITVLNVANTVSKYPMRIYRNPLENKYIALFQHWIPGLTTRVEFSAGELQKANGWIWKDSTYTIQKKRKVLLVPEHFSTPIELERMTIEPNKDSPVEKQKRRSRMV